MMNATTTLGAVSSQSRTMQLALAGLLGLFIVGFVGFSHMEVVHNAGHDYRHSMASPATEGIIIMTYFRNVVFVAAIAGLIAGVAMTLMQAFTTVR
jgi:cobalt transporter subunit CbtB